MRIPRLLAPALGLLLIAGAPVSAAVIKGVVLEYGSGRALARTKVTLEGRGATGVSLSGSTDSSGQFVFDALPAGAYVLVAQRRGFAQARYGQHDYNSPATPIVLEAENSFIAELRMHRLPAITGGITDENGVGLADIPVYAYRAGPRLKLAAAATSDDRGLFRVHGLEPGKYVVRTGARELEDHRGLLPTYFNQTIKSSEARVVALRLDEEYPDVYVEPFFGRLCRLSGTYIGPVPATIVLVTDMGRREQVVTVPAGGFSFDELLPGQYELYTEVADASGQPLSAWVRVVVAKENSDGGTITASPSPQVLFRCRGGAGGGSGSDRETGAAAARHGGAVFFRRVGLSNENAMRAACDSEIRLAAGEYEMAVLPPGDSYVSQITPAMVRDGAYRFSTQGGGRTLLDVAFGGPAISLAGSVATASGDPAVGAPVFLIPLDEELRSRLGGARKAIADSDGKFRFDGLPPGRYQAVSTFQITDPADAADIRDRGKLVHAESGAQPSVALTLESGNSGGR
jgi:hypothetical protein